MEEKYKYYAFISYKREDEKWARWLQYKIENYRLPSTIRVTDKRYPRKLKPVFLDRTDIQPGFLKDELRQELKQSRYLIVICSSRSAKSAWVGKEISDFIAIGRGKNIIPFVIEGIPYSNDPQTECIHPVLKSKLPELIGINIHEEGRDNRFIKREKAFVRVLSAILGVSFDTLWNRHRRRIIKKIVAATTGLLAVLSVIYGVWRYNRPFNVKLLFEETTFRNESLGFPEDGGQVLLIYNKDTLCKVIGSLENPVSFSDIPGRYSGKNAQIVFRSWGYVYTDTVMPLKPSLILPVSRDNTYGTVQGFVRNAGSDMPEEGVVVEIAGKISVTNHNGYFSMDIPLCAQKKRYEAVILKKGKRAAIQIVYPTQGEEKLLNTVYIQ